MVGEMMVKLVGIWYDHQDSTMKVQARNMNAAHGENPYRIYTATQFMDCLKFTQFGINPSFDQINMKMEFRAMDSSMDELLYP